RTAAGTGPGEADEDGPVGDERRRHGSAPRHRRAGRLVRALLHARRPLHHLLLEPREPAQPQLRPLPRAGDGRRARAGDARPRVRRVPHVQPRRALAGVLRQPRRQGRGRDERVPGGMAPLIARTQRGRTLLPAGRALGVFLLALFLFARFRDAFSLPFLNDDYVFLDHVARRGFGQLWGFTELAFHWRRPWSRELHYWWLQRAFGAHEGPFHAASFALAFGGLAAYWALARRLVGAAAAAIAVAGAATLPGWGLLLLWSAGAQDLWMLLMSLLALLAWRADRIGLAALAYALALASKETAAPLPLVFLAHDHWVARRPWPESLLRIAPTFAV